MSEDRFDETVRAVLLERAPKHTPPELRARVAAVAHELPLGSLRGQSRLLAVAAGVAAFLLIGGALLGAIALRGVMVGTDLVHPTPSVSSAGLAHFEGQGFSFNYPATWRILLDYPASSGGGSVVAVGTAGSDVACSTAAPGASDQGSLECLGMNAWSVPADGVIVAFRFEDWRTPALPPLPGATTTPTPLGLGMGLGASPMPGASRVSVDGRAADRVETGGSLIWRFDALDLTAIEARFGPENAAASRAEIEALVASWRWTGSAAPTPSPSATVSAQAAWPFRLADGSTPVRAPEDTLHVSTSPGAAQG